MSHVDVEQGDRRGNRPVKLILRASWPESIVADMRGAASGVALTEPGLVGKRGRHEAIKLTRDAIRAAREVDLYRDAIPRASFGIARRLGRRLRRRMGRRSSYSSPGVRTA